MFQNTVMNYSQGSFFCSCPPGFEVGIDGFKCYRVVMELISRKRVSHSLFAVVFNTNTMKNLLTNDANSICTQLCRESSKWDMQPSFDIFNHLRSFLVKHDCHNRHSIIGKIYIHDLYFFENIDIKSNVRFNFYKEFYLWFSKFKIDLLTSNR